MSNSSIIGTLEAKHTIDPNGSLNIDIPICLPPSNFDPGLTFSYHSAAQDLSDLGTGWVIKGLAIIERVAATRIQDGFLGSVNYDANDRFALNGQRLVQVGDGEYRYEVEQWSKFIAHGIDPANPDYWTEYLPDGSRRVFGQTLDSNIKAQGSATATRTWAICKFHDVFTNHISYSYENDVDSGSYYITSIDYGGNENLSMNHQRNISFTYEQRPDVLTRFFGGHRIHSDKRLQSIRTSANNNHVHTHELAYHIAPLTGRSRLESVTLVDPLGSSVNPVQFKWNNASPAVYNPVKDLSNIDPGVSRPQLLPMDVNANGRTDMVVASAQLGDANSNVLYLDIYLADESGNLSHAPAYSGGTGLDPPTQLLAITANDYGRTDLLHIENVDDDSNGNHVHALTVLLSTNNGYKAQPSFSFVPEAFDGKYLTGDFKADGRTGMIYIYNCLDDNSRIVLRLVQLVQDGTKFKELPAVDIPGGMDLSEVQVVVADLDGDGAEDVLVIWNEGGLAHIHLARSKDGTLQYIGEIVNSTSKPITWYENIGFAAHDVGDGLVGLVAITRDLDGNIQLQALRSTGKSLVALHEPQSTGILYSGQLTIARTTTSDHVDLVIMSTDESSRKVEINVLRYNQDRFEILKGVQQPTTSQYGYNLSSADLRGAGRADCLFTFVDFEGNISLSTLTCAGSPTADTISSYTNGLGGHTTITFAPLTDPNVYTATDESASSPTAYTNALSRNVTSTVPLTSGLASTIVPGRSRTMLVHYPKYVVKEIATCAAPDKAPDITMATSYTYQNARFSPEGRGWLGFENIAQENHAHGTIVKSTYLQEFPFLGQASSVTTTDKYGNSLISNSFTWTSEGGPNQSVQLAKHVESHFETGVHAFDITVSYQYDDFSNVTKEVISVPDSGRPDLTISTEFSNDVESWNLGLQTLHIVDPGDGAITKKRMEYLSKTQSPSSVSKWIQGDEWTTQTFTYNDAGKETSVIGPGLAKTEFTYDETYSFRTTESFHTGLSTSYCGKATYDYASGQVSSITDPNGHITTMTYDVLGRPVTISEGDSLTSMVVMQKFAYLCDSDGAYHYHQTRTSWDQDVWGWESTYLDGLAQEWRKKTNAPEDVDAILCQDYVFDGAGRVVKQSRTYKTGDVPIFASCIFDAQSRLVQKSAPSLDPEVQPVTFTYEYSYSGGQAQVVERKSEEGAKTSMQVSLKKIRYFPNPDPTGDQLVRPLVVKMVDSLNRNIDMIFDGQLRATSAEDPTGVQLVVAWDGLERQIERRIFKESGKTISHFTMSFEDSSCQSTLNNVLTGASAVTTYDYLQRPIKRVTTDETIDLTYDDGGTNAQSRLVSVRTSSGIKHHYDYDTRGNLKLMSIDLGDRTFKTSYEWTPTKKVSRTVNPDGTSIVRTYFDQTSCIKSMIALDNSSNSIASTVFTELNSMTHRPHVCTFGNGLVSTITTADNGTLTSSVLKKNSDVMHSQHWTIDSFSKIQSYKLSSGQTSVTNQFSYDDGGQLTSTHSSSQASDTGNFFTYDDSGNLSSQNSDVWVSDGWQLSGIQNSEGKQLNTFQYSVDGNLTEKLDASNSTSASMSYDADGRLTTVNKASFVYDYQGRLVKATHADGSITYYPNPEFEFTVQPSGKETNTSNMISGWRRAFVSRDTISGVDQESQAYYLLTDHLGSVVAVLDDDGSIVTTYEYDPYGHTMVKGEDVSRYKFSGKEQFEGLYYFGARFYDPELRRFITLDNITTSLENITPQSFNQYTYSQNDPVNYVDINGNVPWWHWLVAGIFIAVGVVATVATGGAASPLVFWSGAIIGGALLGAGTSALQADIMAVVYNDGKVDDKEWWKSIGIGAAIGAITGAAGGAFGKFVAPRIGGALLSRIAGSSSQLFKYFKPFGKWAGTTLAQFGLRTGQTTGLAAVSAFAKSFLIHETLSITVGVGGQLAKNALSHREWDYHLTGVLWISAVTGAFNAGASGLTSGILKKVGSEATVAAEQGLVDAFTQTAGLVIRDTRMITQAFGWERVFSALDRI